MSQDKVHDMAASPWALASLALAAQAVWYAATVGPVVFLLSFGMMWFGAPGAWVVAVGVVSGLFFGWLVTPSVELEGRAITRTEAPLLFAAIDRLCAMLDAAPIDRVVLTDEINAAAHQAGRLGLPWPMRQTLILGVPLLAVLTVQETTAVVAHELGHFSRRHGFFGHWIYRARRSWLRLAAPSEPADSPYERAVQSFAASFAPWFAAKAFAFSRRCEYEADQDAAKAAGSLHLLKALQSIDVANQRVERWHQEPAYLARRLQPDAPTDRWSSMLAGFWRSNPAEHEIAAARSRTASADDTHPSIAQRAAALGVGFDALDDGDLPDFECAGSTLLADRWSTELAQMDAAWHASHRSDWLADSIHLARLARELDAHESMASPWSRRIQLAHALGRQDEVRRIAGAVLVDEATATGPAFLALQARADEGDTDAVQRIEALIAREPAFAAPARAWLLGRARRAGQRAETEKQEALLNRAWSRRHQAVGKVHDAIEQGALQPPSWSPAAIEAFEAQCLAEQVIHRAWFAVCDASSHDGRRFGADVLVVQIDPAAMLAAADQEDRVRDRFVRQLQRWSEGAHRLLVVRTCFNTEAALPAILQGSAALAWRRPQVSSANAPVVVAGASRP